MSDFTNFNDNNDFEEKEDVLWNEFDWHNYLKDTKKSVLNILATYLKVKERPGFIHSIDKVLDSAESIDQNTSPEETDVEEATYTLHRHPLLLITQALYFHLHSTFESFIVDNPGKLSALTSFQFATALHKGQEHALLATYGFETNDAPLAICHLKHAIMSINDSLYTLQNIHLPVIQAAKTFIREVTSTLFDLRELWLRMMNEARSHHHYFQDEDDE